MTEHTEETVRRVFGRDPVPEVVSKAIESAEFMYCRLANGQLPAQAIVAIVASSAFSPRKGAETPQPDAANTYVQVGPPDWERMHPGTPVTVRWQNREHLGSFLESTNRGRKLRVKLNDDPCQSREVQAEHVRLA